MGNADQCSLLLFFTIATGVADVINVRCYYDLSHIQTWRTEGGDQREGEWEPNQILLQESAYVLSSNPKPKPCKKVMNTPTNIVEMISSKLQT
jgi:hypothetical protein